MNDYYGAQTGEDISDEQWIAELTERGFICLGTDADIASVPIQARVIVANDAQVFALARGNAQLTGREQALIFLHHERRIREYALRGGPYAISLGHTSFREMELRTG